MCAMTLGVHEVARYGFHLRQREYPMSLWTVLAGDSASGKSTAITQARKFVEAAWEEATIRHSTSPWIETEGSIPGLLNVFSDLYDPNRRTTVGIMFHHELSAVLNTREPIAEMLCRLADGHDYERNLRELQKGPGKRDDRGGPAKIHSPVLSGLFASTEVALARVFNEAHRAGGLFSRFAWVAPPFDKDDLRFKPDVKPEDDPLYKVAVEHWAGWLGMLGLVDREISLSPAAEAVLRDFFNTQKTYIRDGDPMNGPRLRLVEKARVFAAVFAVQHQDSVVSEADMIYACNLTDVLLEHTEALSHLGTDAIVQKVRRARMLIEASGDLGVPRKVLYERLGINRRAMDEVIGTLLDAGHAIDVKPRGGASTLVSTSSSRGQNLAEHDDLIAKVIEGNFTKSNKSGNDEGSGQ